MSGKTLPAHGVNAERERERELCAVALIGRDVRWMADTTYLMHEL